VHHQEVADIFALSLSAERRISSLFAVEISLYNLDKVFYSALVNIWKNILG
jgi:hypothetical protein